MTFVSDSFVAKAEETVLDTEDCFRVAGWQVLVLSWEGMLELVVERQPALLPFDFHSSATFHVPFDEASEQDYVLVESDGLLGLFVALPLTFGADPRLTYDASPMGRVDSVKPSAIVAGIVSVVELREMIPRRVVGPLGSLKDVGADEVVAAVDGSEVLSSEIADFAEGRVVAARLSLGSVNDHSLTDLNPYDCSLDVVPTKI